MIPTKPFDTYKWRWLSYAPTEGLLNPPVFLGVLRVLSRHEEKSPSDDAVINELQKVTERTGTRVDLARTRGTGKRNLIRNSGQYWIGMGLIVPDRGNILLTPLGRQVARGKITRSEFAAIMIQQTVMPNHWTDKPVEIEKWNAAGLKIKPLRMILEIIEHLGLIQQTKSPYLMTDELIKIVIPLAGTNISSKEIARHINLFRDGKISIKDWPNCAPGKNDGRMARQFLLFLTNFEVLRREKGTSKNDEKYYLDNLPQIDAIDPVEDSIFGGLSEAKNAVDQIKNSILPSIVERQRIQTSFLYRSGQRKFRKDVVSAFRGRCFLTDESIPEILEAAHIIPVKHKGGDKAENGLCLRVDIHRLFDSGNLQIKSNGNLNFSDSLSNSPNYKFLPKKIIFPRFINIDNIIWREEYY